MEDLSLYLHIPFCLSKCGYCSFNSITDLSQKNAYTKALICEMKKSSSNLPVVSVYLGGGTPSLLDECEIASICEALAENFNLQSAEFSIECNPDTITKEKVHMLKKYGINRVSLGVQSFDDEILNFIGRRHDSKKAIQAIELLKGEFENLSVDFMLNLQGQTRADLDSLFFAVQKYQIPHISCYGLKLEEGTPLQKKITDLDEDYAADLYDYAVQGLLALGLIRYEISNFSKPGYECKHNLRYWDLSDYLGLGVSAHSYIAGTRFENGDCISNYLQGNRSQKVVELSQKDTKFEYIMLALRTSLGVNIKKYKELFSSSFIEEYSGIIGQYKAFFDVNSERVRISEQGIYVVNSLLIKFL